MTEHIPLLHNIPGGNTLHDRTLCKYIIINIDIKIYQKILFDFKPIIATRYIFSNDIRVDGKSHLKVFTLK